MIAMLWAQQIMLGKKTYAEVPETSESKGKRNPGRFRNGENWQRKNDETADNK